ncbi:preprotein translocase subunit YajC [Streptomyces sp. NBC_01476]|uniref:preprotein translocase subunit YajC n=1 Tax=Streptomyces sp. NBC_01476 TaxID=2903881 RepID=UPI002E2F7266|nr:preprotein translocase subunit YajC [Streptomyces sp. NBC_01476]
MNLVTLLPLILIVGVMFLMTRSAKNKQRQASQMRNQMEPGAGVRTIGGMYAVVKEVNDETVLLELTDGVHAHFAKNAIGAVLSEGEFNRIVHGIEPEETEDESAEDAAGDAAGTKDTSGSDEAPVDLTKDDEDAPVELTKDAEPQVQEQDGSTAGSKSK